MHARRGAKVEDLLHQRLAPVVAFVSFFFGIYGLFFAAGRADWPVVTVAALATLAGAVGAFVVRKTRPRLTFGLATAPATLLLMVLVLR